VFNALNDYFRFVKDKNIQFFNLDFYIFIKSLKINNDDLIYLDPPYLISFSEYNKIWNEEKERLLLNLLDELDHKNVKFAISNIIEYKGRKNKIFINWMKQYNEHRINSNYISYHDNSIKKIDEVLITNY
jgi:DNA adenine methylase